MWLSAGGRPERMQELRSDLFQINRRRLSGSRRSKGRIKESGFRQKHFRFSKKILSEEEVATGTVIFAARALFFLILFFWGWGFIFSALKGEYSGDSVLHYVNLVFHEAGHIIFWGKFMAVLGGSLMQIIIPGCCVASFLYYRNPFAAAAALWWLAENFMDMAPYINDARALQLPLLGGITGSDDPDSHDWHFLLRETGWLEYDQILARLSSHIGILLMITSFAWMIWTLRQQFKSIRSYKSAL